MDVLQESVHLFNDGELVDCVRVIGAGLFVEVFDEGRFVINKFACKNNEVLLQKSFEFNVLEGRGVHDGGTEVRVLVRMRLFF